MTLVNEEEITVGKVEKEGNVNTKLNSNPLTSEENLYSIIYLIVFL